MIDVAKIQDSLIGLIGFKQPFNPDYAIVDSDNQLSKSGYFVTDNPYSRVIALYFLFLENLKEHG